MRLPRVSERRDVIAQVRHATAPTRQLEAAVHCPRCYQPLRFETDANGAVRSVCRCGSTPLARQPAPAPGPLRRGP